MVNCQKQVVDFLESLLDEEIYLFVETDQLYRNYGSVVVATVATACSGS
mgnify:CR=1 FL=1